MAATAAHQALLVLSLAALGAAALRSASAVAPGGLERVVAAAALGVAAAVVEALVLGFAGLGGSGVAAAAGAGATWVVSRATFPAPQRALAAELGEAWRAAGAPARIGLGALAGGLAGLAAAQLYTPYLGLDGGTYHLSQVVRWVQDGTPGSVEAVYSGLPVGNYPLTAEVALTWAAALSHSLAPVALWTPALVALFAASWWLGMRELQVPRWAIALSAAALLLVPVTLRGAIQVETDFPALAWLGATAALVACSRRRPLLLAPALVAGGLALGTKTTTLPALVLLTALAMLGLRGRLRELARPLLAAALLAVAVGDVWYLRNLITHGSPLWPFVAGPFGDPVPTIFQGLDQSFLQRPVGPYASEVLPTYRAVLAGGLVLLGGALLAPLWARGRAVVVAAALTLLALLAWANAPFTGAGTAPFVQIQAVRYMIPALAAAAVAVALGSRAGRRAAWTAAALLIAAVVWSLYRYWQLAYLPREWMLIAGALAGALAAGSLRGLRPRLLAAGAAVLAAVVLTEAVPGYAPRHREAGEIDSGLLRWLDGQPRWRDGSSPLGFYPVPVALAAASELEHPLRLVFRDDSCARVRAQARAGWLVLAHYDETFFPTKRLRGCLGAARPSFEDGSFLVYGRGGSNSSAGAPSHAAVRSRSCGRTVTAQGAR